MPHFKLTYKVINLVLENPFTISRGSKSSVSNVFVALTDGTYTGHGEAGPNVRYDENAEKVKDYIETLPDDFFDDIETEKSFLSKLRKHNQSLPASIRSVKSAQTALEMAWLDWHGKKQGQPLWKIWNAPTSTGPVTSFTIGLDDIDIMQQKIEAAAKYPLYKVKLGTGRDREIIKGLREVTDKPIRVDANEGWTTLEEARDYIDFLAEQNIQFVEQPMPAGQVDDLRKLHAFSPIPLCADESFLGGESLETIEQAFDIINIKLMKTGSLIKARQIIKEAHGRGIKVMIGCMIESSLAIAAGTLLSLWADYADLDGNLLINNDPAAGLDLTPEKKIMMNDNPGLGIKIL